MTISPPTRVTEQDLRAALCDQLPDSGVCARLKEQAQDYARWQRQRDAEEAQLRRAREARLAAQEAERAAQRVTEREAARAAEDDQLRNRLRAANPTITAAEIEDLLPELRRAEMVQRAAADRDREVEALRQRVGSLSF